MTTSLIAMGVAIFAVINLVVGLFALSLLFGTFETLFGKPKLTLLRSSKSGNFFAFGSPTSVEVSKNFEAKTSSFAFEADMGPGFIDLLGATNFDNSVVEVQVCSVKDGINFCFEMKGSKFKKLVSDASLSVEQFISNNKLDVVRVSAPPIDIPVRSFVADTVPGRGPQLKLSTNPVFAGEFSAAGPAAAGGAPAAASVPNFSVTKVWIEPGCIVCNACEDIYKDVFEVKADTCIIRPNAPLDDGLRIQEAAEACPVEVIKFTKAS